MQAFNSIALSPRDTSKNSSSTNRTIPAADIVETDSKFLVFVNVPGLSSSEIEISVEAGVLTLEGASMAPFARAYFRQFKLSDSVDATHIIAKLNSGVLELTFPKTTDSKRKIIPLSTD